MTTSSEKAQERGREPANRARFVPAAVAWLCAGLVLKFCYVQRDLEPEVPLGVYEVALVFLCIQQAQRKRERGSVTNVRSERAGRVCVRVCARVRARGARFVRPGARGALRFAFWY